ncbi:hypothetical protein DENSPDRAFT_849001 [Dentipellis sp. KUC8613]|nr:hypothetical protein DENSPDRAFT_849001 [Dentipellis sp. KUC8613]
MLKIQRMKESFMMTPQAPRMGRIPLPEVVEASPRLRRSETPQAVCGMQTSSSRGHRRHPSSQDSGYFTSPEAQGPSTKHKPRAPSSSSTTTTASSSSASTSAPTSRTRRPSDARTSMPKGILKHGSADVDRDGYASSPEKQRAAASRAHPAPLRGAPTPPVPAPPAALHWKLLPFSYPKRKARVSFDVRFHAEHIDLIDAVARTQRRPLTVTERKKPASEPALHEMTIRCAELPEWPVYVARGGAGITCIDVFREIYEQLSIVLTNPERRMHADRLRGAHAAFEERCRRASMLEREKGYRRFDLLAGKSYFGGLDWVAPSKEFPDGYWALLLSSKDELRC